MPVRKFRSVEDMPEASFREAGDPSNLRIACELSTTAFRLALRRFPSGVHRYRSVALASEQRELWERSAGTIRPAHGDDVAEGSSPPSGDRHDTSQG
jgi:hypothetical protein